MMLKPFLLPKEVTSLGECAFFECTSLDGLVIPDSIAEIDSGAFQKVPHIYYHGNAIGSPWGALNKLEGGISELIWL